MNPFIASLIRTVVPVIVGAVITWLAGIGLNLDVAGQEGLALTLTVIFTAAYYFVVRFIEERVPWVGVFLGYANAPAFYVNPQTDQVNPAPSLNLNVARSDTSAEDVSPHLLLPLFQSCPASRSSRAPDTDAPPPRRRRRARR